ncbi:alpha/beta hydrolase [Micromonospora sp. URMC 103]|uniref:alpha/beta hydrolase n=1 Tax=Micromonospora sp. URMC 103 TaxID=3423406 RepID=UPI003F1DF1CA
MADRRAVLIPGRAYDTRAPLFAYAGEALRRAGYDLHEITWTVPSGLAQDSATAWVADQVAPALDAPTDLLVGKSLGTCASGVAADRRLPAVWLTPLLHQPEVIEALARATAPFLLIGGTGDPSWDPSAARRLTPHLVEIHEADHSLMLPGPLARSAEALGRICTGIEEFARII